MPCYGAQFILALLLIKTSMCVMTMREEAKEKRMVQRKMQRMMPLLSNPQIRKRFMNKLNRMDQGIVGRDLVDKVNSMGNNDRNLGRFDANQGRLSQFNDGNTITRVGARNIDRMNANAMGLGSGNFPNAVRGMKRMGSERNEGMARNRAWKSNERVQASQRRSTLDDKEILWRMRGQKYSEEKNRRLPDFVIIGSKKCGTGAFRTFLSLHSKIVPPK